MTAQPPHVSTPDPSKGRIPPDRSGFMRRVEQGAHLIQTTRDEARDAGRTPSALLFSDMDVDGITSHTIMRVLLERVGFQVEPMFSKKLDDEIMERLRTASHDLVIITDHGAPPREEFGTQPILVLDHHKPPDLTQDHSHQIHPVLHGLNGAVEICSAGIAYLLARALDGQANRDLAALAVIGSAGDMLDLDAGRFVGLTRDEVLADAVASGAIEARLDLRLYGRHARTLADLLAYSDDPHLEGLSANKDACCRYLHARGIHPETRWYQLDEPTRQELVADLLDRASDPTRLLGEVYELAAEAPGSQLRDVKEYGTVINGSSRYEKPEVAVAILRGDRGTAYDRALDNYQGHKRNIARAIQLIHELGVTQRHHLQWFHVEGLVRHTIIGSAAGAVQSKYDPDKPIIGFAFEENQPSLVKVSGRGHRSLCDRGLDLSRVMKECAQAVGGKGGGHDVAAGATIPAGQEERFLDLADAVLAEQMA